MICCYHSFPNYPFNIKGLLKSLLSHIGILSIVCRQCVVFAFICKVPYVYVLIRHFAVILARMAGMFLFSYAYPCGASGSSLPREHDG